MNDIHSILKQYWGYPAFRPLQEQIIRAVLSKKDCLALLPTGGGKSICFQVPAMAQPGLCLVISPLIALMKDQVESLRKKNITAFAIYSGMSARDIAHTFRVAANSNCKFLYMSPERLQTSFFKEYVHGLGISLVAVDEAHCISQWGYDFRPSYLKISELREELPDVPILALTASATTRVQKDICDQLLFKDADIFRQSFERPNLSYSAFETPSTMNKLTEILQKISGSGIVYCKTRKRTRELSELLNMQGIDADFYHAGLNQEERNQKQDNWLKNKNRIMVCTNAFGMGIDKSDVRIVVHADIPDCLENYYQEAGRAGRDGKRSYAVLLFQKQHLDDLRRTAEVRFPKIHTIRKIYSDLMNHLQIASGTGENMYFELDLNHFVKHFELDLSTVSAVLKTLEQGNILCFNEQVFSPSTLQITAPRQILADFERENADLEPLLKCLLRTYGGIMDQPVKINEKLLARSLGSTQQNTAERLKQLSAAGIARYVPQKDQPQVYLVHNRVKSDELSIDMNNHEKRKKQYEHNVQSMIAYAVGSQACRSVTIGNYFGDDMMKPCGICDVCLNKKKAALSSDEFEKIHSGIMNLIGRHSMPLNTVVEGMKGISREKVMQAIGFLQSENRIDVTEQGFVTSKKVV